MLDNASRRWLGFFDPIKVISARHVSEVLPALSQVERETERGFWVAGFITYEASPAFDPALATHQDVSGIPLLWFAVYRGPQTVAPPDAPHAVSPINWQPSISREQYESAFQQIKAYIAAGETYQVNYTFRLRARLNVNPWELFARAADAQGRGYMVYVETDDWIIGSVSPELFFELDGERLVAKPMKGTACRGLRLEDDLAQGSWLQRSEKNRAENVMIVDMVRNDLGRVARPGSVRVRALFEVEKYRTVWQMTSTVECETCAGLADLFQAMFPPPSVTGAPKVRTTQLIRSLESTPRRIYTGAMGYCAPGRRAQFNVAIRTFLFEKATNQIEYGVGGGIVWDSKPDDEFDEAYAKVRILSQTQPKFALLETMRWTPAGGFDLLDRHLSRMAKSAAFFDFPFDEAVARQLLTEHVPSMRKCPQRVRLVLDSEGRLSVETAALTPLPPQYRVRLATEPISSTNPLLFHKTTFRAPYDNLRLPDCEDVLLWNERGELTESTLANLVVEKKGKLFTPPLECGLLPGTARSHLIAQGTLHETVIHIEELPGCDRVFLLNSVRGLWQVFPILSVRPTTTLP